MDKKPKKKKLDFEKEIIKKVSKVEKDTRQIQRKNEKVLNEIKTWVEKGEWLLQRIEKQNKSFEETLLYLYHNIKKNQFLYAHYPDDWVKDYLDIKEGLKYENERLSVAAE